MYLQRVIPFSLIFQFVSSSKPSMLFKYDDTEQTIIDGPVSSVWDIEVSQLMEYSEKSHHNSLLRAYPSALSDGEDLVISWISFAAQSDQDFITISCGPTQDNSDFLTKKNVNKAMSSLRFPALYALRCNYLVKYFNQIAENGQFRILDSIEVPMNLPPTAPRYGHISFTENNDEMTVMYVSSSNNVPSVKFGERPNALTAFATGTSATYTSSDMCHEPANIISQVWFRDPGYQHKVILKHLKPSTEYFYQFGDDNNGYSKIYSFFSKPPTNYKGSVKFIAYADMGVDDGPAAVSTNERVLVDIFNNDYNAFLLHFGDIAYGLGHGYIWDQFFHLIEPVATRVPYMVSIGNHEYDYTHGGKGKDPSGAVDKDGRMAFHPKWANFGFDSRGECSVPMFYRWSVPKSSPTSNSLYWYSFSVGEVLTVIQMSSEHDWTKGSVQYAWLESTLRSIDRKKSPWIILTSHRMMYTTQLGETADLIVSINMRQELEVLLVKYKVNLVLVGHQHSYERSCPVINGECVKDGEQAPVHVVVGSAGASLEKEGFSSKIGKWSVSHINDWGYLRIEANPGNMNVQFVLNRNGQVYDEVTLQPWQ